MTEQEKYLMAIQLAETAAKLAMTQYTALGDLMVDHAFALLGGEAKKQE